MTNSVKKYSDEYLLAPISEFYRDNGRPPKFREIPHASTVSERFGSFANALKMCGIESFAKPAHRKPSGKDCVLNGYRIVYRPFHFNCNLGDNYRGYVYEHRYVVECKIGRALNRDEVVHHLDLNRMNNDPSNLIVLSRSDHTKLHAWIRSALISK